MGLTARELTTLSAAAAAATAAAAAGTSAAAARGRALLARTGFVDCQGATLDFLARKGLDGGFSAFGRGHGDKTKTARTTAHAISDEVNLGNRAMLLEQILQIILGGVEGKISHVQFRIHFICMVVEMLAGFRELFPIFRVSNHH
jgi:hypothetical protein